MYRFNLNALKLPFNIIGYEHYLRTGKVHRQECLSYTNYLLRKYCFAHVPAERILRKMDYVVFKTEKLLREQNYDVVFTASAPMETHCLMYHLRHVLRETNTLWFQLVEDPHSEYIGLRAQRKELRKAEKAYYSCADLIFTFPQIIHNPQDVLNEFKNKVVLVQYPNFRFWPEKKCDITLSKKQVHLLYVGSLQDRSIRDPEYLYRIINSAKGTNLHFHFVVNYWDEENQSLRDRMMSSSSNITFHNRMSIDSCIAFMQHVHILINISNRATNQVPGKIFDYISIGKPIVNIYSSIDDPVLDILRNYPLLLNIYEADDVQESTQSLLAFAQKQFAPICQETLSALYHTYTAQEAAQPILDILDNTKSEK